MTKVGGKVAVAYTSFKEGGYKGVISAGLDFIPIVGNAKALVEAAIGRDPITGRKLESWERGASAAAILGGPLVKGVKHGAKLGAKAISGGTSSSKKTVNLAKSPTPTNPTKQQAPSQAKKEASATTAPPAKSNQNAKGIDKTRPSWRQSEIDVGKEYPGYRDQVSYKDGKEVSHGTKNSSRPDFYINGHSIEVKNYNLTTSSGRSNLIRNVSKQVNKRMSDLPENTKQTVIIDVRGQNVSRDVLRDVKQKINERTNGVPEIIYKMD
ncbi:pre-toxin TG domain-containing protein [Solibacillus sp. FSL R7-0682]|uniref:pre-toxin TG domain-containing protein n=1 Tax=Solibacillus sp. FSL R7-0682 TaxID=2921690 RepID=UPI0030F87CA5